MKKEQFGSIFLRKVSFYSCSTTNDCQGNGKNSESENKPLTTFQRKSRLLPCYAQVDRIQQTFIFSEKLSVKT